MYLFLKRRTDIAVARGRSGRPAEAVTVLLARPHAIADGYRERGSDSTTQQGKKRMPRRGTDVSFARFGDRADASGYG
jgi:hypothetical protein